MPKIERHAGIPIEGTPYAAGGGYRGATRELDAAVQKAAEALSEAFGRDVEIRFNSDRPSGGAWLKDDLPGFSGSCQVGINDALRHWRGPGDESLYISGPQTVVKAPALKHPEICPESAASLTPSLMLDHPSLEAAIRWLKRNIDHRWLGLKVNRAATDTRTPASGAKSEDAPGLG